MFYTPVINAKWVYIYTYREAYIYMYIIMEYEDFIDGPIANVIK